jgi:hypothetical protein
MKDIVEMGIDEDKSIKEMVKGMNGCCVWILPCLIPFTCFDPQSLSVWHPQSRESYFGE